MAAVNVDWAVQLFEQGYTEDQIEQALRECRTFQAAKEWLEATRPASEAGSPSKSSANSPPSGQLRRRVVRKVSEETMVVEQRQAVARSLCQRFAAADGNSRSSSSQAVEEERAPIAVVPLAPVPVPVSRSDAVAIGVPAAGAVSIQPASSGLTIDARDATNFWTAAAALWRKKSTAEFGGPSQEEEEAQEEEPAPDADAEEAEDASEHDSAGENEAEGEEDQTEQDEPEQRSQKRLRQSEPEARSPPAAAAAEASSPGALDPRRFSCMSGSAGSTPHKMKLNSKEEVCGICCNDVPALRAVRLGCSHGWYCAHCVFRHAEARIQAGAAVVTCPECCTPVAERDLRKLVPEELMDKLLSRSLEQAVASAADLKACPTPNCPMRVALEDGGSYRFKCTICNKSSCLKCGAQPWHRGTCEEYAARRQKRKRDSDGFQSLQKWIEETGTKQCPTCRMAVSKQNLHNQHTQYSECHKMCCRNCSTKFCFKCLAVLSDTFTCGCTIDAHGFVDPNTGKRINHLRRGAGKAKAKVKAKAKARR